MSVSVLVFQWPLPEASIAGSACTAPVLFSHDIAGTSDFEDFWHQPALRLGLHLLAAVDVQGRCFQAEELKQLLAELDLLERHWESLDFGAAMRGESTPLGECLRWGLAAVRRAVAVARERGAILSLG